MNTELRAYTVTAISSDEFKYHYDIVDHCSNKKRSIIVNKEIPIPIDTENKTVIEFIGKIPSDRLSQLKGSGVGIREEDCEAIKDPLCEGDVIVLRVQTLESLIEATLNKK